MAKEGNKAWIRGLAAGLIVVASAGIVGYLFWGDTRTAPVSANDDGATKKKISAVAPSVSAPKEQPKKKFDPRSLTREERLAAMERRYGTNIPERLQTTYYFLKNPPEKVFKPRPRREDIFQHHSERSIAAILLLQPGAFILQRSTYDESFDHDFEKSLREPTLILETDTPEERELKEAVNEVKADLAMRMKNGEKPSDILTKTMDEAYELSKYASNLEEMIRNVDGDPTKTDQDVKDFVEAANQMLRDKGAREIAMPTLFNRRARLRIQARKQEQQKLKDNNP